MGYVWFLPYVHLFIILGYTIHINMRMNEETKLMYALEHIAHLEDYIARTSPLYHPLSTIKIGLEKQLSDEQGRKRR